MAAAGNIIKYQPADWLICKANKVNIHELNIILMVGIVKHHQRLDGNHQQQQQQQQKQAVTVAHSTARDIGITSIESMCCKSPNIVMWH